MYAALLGLVQSCQGKLATTVKPKNRGLGNYTDNIIEAFIEHGRQMAKGLKGGH